MPEKSLSDRIAERLGQSSDVTNRNRNWMALLVKSVDKKKVKKILDFVTIAF